MTLAWKRVVGLGIIIAFVSASGTARADERQQCVAASEKAQQLRNASKLSDAREQLAICARSECPKLIQQDCSEWMKEVLQVIPSVVPGAKDRAGRDVVDVRVWIDGKVVTERLDGKPLPVDPGVHKFRYEAKGAPPLEEQVVVRQGEQNRILTVVFKTPEDKPPPLVPAEKPSPPIAAYVTAGIGVLAAAVGTYVLLDADGDARDLRATCAPQCEQSQVDDIENRRVIGGVSIALGGAALVAGVILYLTHSSGSKSSSARIGPGFARIHF